MKQILSIEDGVLDAAFLENILKDKYLVEIVTTIEEARCSIELNPPDLIILDLLLPDSEGIETVISVKGFIEDLKPKVIPLIVYTATLSDRYCLDYMCYSVLEKGKTTVKELLDVISILLTHCQIFKTTNTII